MDLQEKEPQWLPVNHLKPGWDHLQAPEGACPADMLISDFYPPEEWDDKCLLLGHPVCGTFF